MVKNDSPSKPQRVLVEHASNTPVTISAPAFYALARKAGHNKISLTILEQVYCRGVLASVQSNHTPEQQAFQRVNSFVAGGKAYEMDCDLIGEAPKVPDGKKHMSIIKNAIKRHEEINKETPKDETIQETGPLSGLGNYMIRGIGRSLVGGRRKKTKSIQDVVNQKIMNKEIDYRVKQGFEKMHPELAKTSQANKTSQNLQKMRRQHVNILRAERKGQTLKGRAGEIQQRYREAKRYHRAQFDLGGEKYAANKTGLDPRAKDLTPDQVQAIQKAKGEYVDEYKKQHKNKLIKPSGTGTGSQPSTTKRWSQSVLHPFRKNWPR